MPTNYNLLREMIWKLMKFLLYSNVWIAVAAVALSLQTAYIYTGQISLTKLQFFILTSTLFVYAAHRLVALKKLESNQWQERFFYISKAQRWIFAYASLAALTSGVLFFFLSRSLQLAILLPGLLSLAYVFPVLKGKRRIRDIHFLKIFLIALVWAWVTVFLPAIDLYLEQDASLYLIGFERLCFIFAITIPFDIRDLLLDQQQSVKTLPGVIGLKAARQLAATLLVLSLFTNLYLWYGEVYSSGQLVGLLISSIAAFILIVQANLERPDYYFTGLLDGTMLLQFSLFYLLS
ncbi:MAG: hypothetical protein Sapg2KO_41990 [Saprospiraceae bacterium]